MNLPSITSCTVSIIGLGYVGLPLAIQIAKTRTSVDSNQILNRKVIGFDIDLKRIEELNKGYDYTGEVSKEDLADNKYINFTSNFQSLDSSDVYIVTVPTPIDANKNPDLRYLISASEIVGKSIKKRKEILQGSLDNSSPIIIFESTVYPGATEEICASKIEEVSGIIYNSKNLNNSFYCGYSPERINPGDLDHRISDITKVTSGSNKIVAEWIDKFYSSIIKAGTHKTSSIKVAEAAKVIENTQRDLNIALANELSIIFNLMNIDTLEVIEAAGTKWNFQSFKPGFVGGHCIGVDPYYLTHKSKVLGYEPQVVLAGRKINNYMPKFIVVKLIQAMAKNKIVIGGSKVLVMGFTFKANCCDTRNTGTAFLIDELLEYDIKPVVWDPWIKENQSYNGCLIKKDLTLNNSDYSAILLTVAHKQFLNLTINEWDMVTNNGESIIIDLKGAVPQSINPIRI